MLSDDESLEESPDGFSGLLPDELSDDESLGGFAGLSLDELSDEESLGGFAGLSLEDELLEVLPEDELPLSAKAVTENENTNAAARIIARIFFLIIFTPLKIIALLSLAPLYPPNLKQTLK